MYDENNNTITVTVTPVPGTPVPVVLTEGATVSDALEAASINAEGKAIRVDGNAGDLTTSVGHGSRVYLTRQVKGN